MQSVIVNIDVASLALTQIELRKKHSEVVSENKKILESNGRLREENSDLKHQQER